MKLDWHRRKGIGGLWAMIDNDNTYYDIRIADPDGYDLSIHADGRHRHLGRFARQVDAKRAAEKMTALE